MSVKFKDVEPVIPYNATVKCTRMSHLVELQYMEKVNHSQTIQKLSKDEYVCLTGDDIGEIKEFKHTDNRSQGYTSLSKTFKKLRYLINNNFQGGRNELFITLTYAENMTDTKRLYTDFDKFIKKLKWHFDKLNISFEYINVIEPQSRGAWHCHCLFKFSENIFIENSWLREKWGQGFVNVHRINDVDNIGAYLTAYLADLEITENTPFEDLQGFGYVEKTVTDIDGKKAVKRFIKGGRLHLYPVGVNIYRKSKGIVMPESVYACYDDIKNAVTGSAKPHYSKGVELLNSDEDDKHINTIIYEQYNLKR